jgi:hypothetical protein
MNVIREVPEGVGQQLPATSTGQQGLQAGRQAHTQAGRQQPSVSHICQG